MFSDWCAMYGHRTGIIPEAMPQQARHLVSVIMPAHNAAPWIAEAVRSVLEQTHRDVELLIVNDGSTDGTAATLDGLHDPRIVRIDLPRNQGVSHARNLALDRMRGDLVCFLDADDRMPPDAIAARLAVLEADPSLSFVDGTVERRDERMERVLSTRTPSFTGEPLDRLLRFDPSCFLGNTWMIRREAIGSERFDTTLSHAEDLHFFMRIARGRRYGHTTATVLHYRRSPGTSMSRLDALERSYRRVLRWMREHPEIASPAQRLRAGYLVRRMMCGAWWKAGRPLKALLAWR